MKFGQFMSYYKRNNLIKKFCNKGDLKTSFRPFCVCKELSTTKSACRPPQIPYYRGFFENWKGPGTSFFLKKKSVL